MSAASSTIRPPDFECPNATKQYLPVPFFCHDFPKFQIAIDISVHTIKKKDEMIDLNNTVVAHSAVIRVVALQQRSLVPSLRLLSAVVADTVTIGVGTLCYALFFVFGHELLVVIRPINKVLSKHAKVHKECHESAGEPAEVDKHVSAVDLLGLAVLAAPLTALGLKGKDGQHIGNVAQASKQEEEHAQAVRRLAAVVENQLGHARRNVRHGA